MNLIKYKKRKEDIFKKINRKIDSQEIVFYSVQTAMGAIFTQQLINFNLGGTIASAVAMLGIGYINNKVLDKLTNDRFYESSVALGLFKRKYSKGKKQDLEKFNDDIATGITTDEILNDYKNIKKDALITHTLCGGIALIGLNNFLKDNLILGVFCCSIAFAFALSVQMYVIRSNNEIKYNAKYFNSRYNYNEDNDEYELIQRN